MLENGITEIPNNRDNRNEKKEPELIQGKEYGNAE